MSTATVNIPTQVSNHANLAAFPVTGALKTIYIAEDTNLEYRWTGSAYQVLGTAGSGIQSVTGDGVDNTDPLNPVLTFPTLDQVLTEGNTTGGNNIVITNGDLIKASDNKSVVNIGTGGTVLLDTSNGTGAESYVYLDPTNAIIAAATNAAVSLTNNSTSITNGTQITLTAPSVLVNNNVLSGTNTGDNATNSQYSGLATSKEDAANKSTSQGDIASNVKFPVWSAVVTYVTSLGYLLSSTAASTYQAILTGTNFGTFLTGLTGKTTPVDADEFVISDSAASNVAKKVTGTNFKAYLKTYFDTLYQAVGTYLTSANITQTITNGVTDKAPSEDAVYDALQLKADSSTERVFLNGGHTTSTPADGTTYVFGALPLPLTGTGSSGGKARIYFPITGTLVYARITFTQTAGSNQTSTIYLRLNNTTDTTLSSAVTNDAAATTFVNSALSISGSTTDYVEFKWVCPTWVTNPTGVFASWELGFKL